MKSCMVGGLQVVVLSFEFHQNRLSGFGAVGGRNLPIPIDVAIGLYNSLYYRTSRDNVCHSVSQSNLGVSLLRDIQLMGM